MGETKKRAVRNDAARSVGRVETALRDPTPQLPAPVSSGLAKGSTGPTADELDCPASPRTAASPFVGAAKGVYGEDEAVSYIRRLRDE